MTSLSSAVTTYDFVDGFSNTSNTALQINIESNLSRSAHLIFQVDEGVTIGKVELALSDRVTPGTSNIIYGFIRNATSTPNESSVVATFKNITQGDLNSGVCCGTLFWNNFTFSDNNASLKPGVNYSISLYGTDFEPHGTHWNGVSSGNDSDAWTYDQNGKGNSFFLDTRDLNFNIYKIVSPPPPLPSENTTFENVNVTNNLTVGNNLDTIRGFFDFLGSSISRVIKGWFKEIDTINITTENIIVNGSEVCLKDGTNCPSAKGSDHVSFIINIKDTIRGTKSSKNYVSLSGTNNFNVKESKIQNVMPTDCIFKNLYVDVETNTHNTNSTVTLRINGADGNISVIIPGNTKGVFNNTINVDNVNAGDLVNYKIAREKGHGKTKIRSLAILCEIK